MSRSLPRPRSSSSKGILPALFPVHPGPLYHHDYCALSPTEPWQQDGGCLPLYLAFVSLHESNLLRRHDNDLSPMISAASVFSGHSSNPSCIQVRNKQSPVVDPWTQGTEFKHRDAGDLVGSRCR